MSEYWVSNDYRSKLGDCIAMLSYWLKNLMPFFQPLRSNTVLVAPSARDFFRAFSRALSKLHVIANSSDWFIALLGPVGIGRSNYVIVFRKSIESRFSFVSNHHKQQLVLKPYPHFEPLKNTLCK